MSSTNIFESFLYSNVFVRYDHLFMSDQKQHLFKHFKPFCLSQFLNQAHASFAGWCAPGFLKLFLCGCLYACVCMFMCVCVCVCVFAPIRYVCVFIVVYELGNTVEYGC